MTTIASDGKTVAADGLSVCGHTRTQSNARKLRVVDGVLYGLTGDWPVFDAAIRWHQAGAEPEKAPKVDDPQWSLLVFRPDHIDRYTAKCPYADSFPYPTAFGSGSEFAEAAMACGRTPEQAVKVAATLDVYTGGEILVIDLASVLGVNGLKQAAE